MRRKKTKREKAQVGRELKEQREAAGISPEGMADRLEVTEKTIQNYEGGNVQQPKSVLISYEVICDPELRDLVKAVSSCDHVYGSQDPLPFDEDESSDVVDLRERRVAHVAQKDPADLYAIAN